MNNVRTSSALKMALALVVVMSIAFAGGCTGSKSETVTAPGAAPKLQGQSALEALGTAESALTTAAPDGKLLLVQTAGATTTTSTPVWAYLFGSPKTNKLFVVRVDKGKAEGPSAYGTAKKGEIEWDKVPASSEIKIDSSEAFAKAFTASKVKGTPDYVMGVVTYVPSSQSTSTAEPMVWNVQFDPAAGFSGIVRVNAKTGQTTTTQ